MTAKALPLLLASTLRLEMTVEEGGTKASFTLDLKPGVLRITPEEPSAQRVGGSPEPSGDGGGAPSLGGKFAPTQQERPEAQDLFLLFESAGPRFTLVRPKERFYCRLSPEDFRRLVDNDVVRLAWIPWAYRVSRDLLEETTVAAKTPSRFEVFSKTYERVVAVYEVAPGTPPALFFQWRESYLEFFSEGDAAADEASRKRLEIYARLPGLPLLMEERFHALSRPRITRVVSRKPTTEDAFTWPREYAEKSASALLREAALNRVLKYLGLPSPKERREREKREDAVRDRKK